MLRGEIDLKNFMPEILAIKYGWTEEQINKTSTRFLIRLLLLESAIEELNKFRAQKIGEEAEYRDINRSRR